MTIIFHVSSLKYVFPLENYDKVINFRLYVNKVEIDKILRKFTGRKLHLCIIHTKPNYIKSFRGGSFLGRFGVKERMSLYMLLLSKTFCAKRIKKRGISLSDVFNLFLRQFQSVSDLL